MSLVVAHRFTKSAQGAGVALLTMAPIQWVWQNGGSRKGAAVLTWQNDKFLVVAAGVSALAHATLLSITFIPEPAAWRDPEPLLVAVLVNSQTEQAPKNPALIAQANQDGGGELEEKNRSASSPAPKSFKMQSLKTAPSPAPSEAKKSVESLEREVERLLELSKKSAPSREAPQASAAAQSEDEASQQMAIDLAARIERQMAEYASRPKKVFVGASAAQSDFAAWVEGWQGKVEQVGNSFYPEQAKGKTRGALILTAGVKKDGSIESVKIDKSSGSPVLDQAAERILRLSAPFEPFSEPMRKKADVLYITRQWRFGPSGLAGLESAQ